MRRSEPFPLEGPAGTLEAELHRPAGETAFRSIVSHPHPLYGGTMDNGVVMLAARALVAAGGETLRFNFRGVGGSDGLHDEGRGERLDLEAAIDALLAREPALPLLLAGYSFGAVMTLDHLTDTSRAGSGGGPRRAIDVAGSLLIAPPVTHYQTRSWELGSIPTVVVYGDRDALTPPALLEEQAARWGRSVRCQAIPGVGHDLGAFTVPRVLETTLDAAVASLAAASTRRA
jgi:alpha/beta superfamily hydrolase